MEMRIEISGISYTKEIRTSPGFPKCFPVPVLLWLVLHFKTPYDLAESLGCYLMAQQENGRRKATGDVPFVGTTPLERGGEET